MIQTAGAYTPEMFHGGQNMLDPRVWLTRTAALCGGRWIGPALHRDMLAAIIETPESPSIHAGALRVMR